jgi:hypothetical protein
LDPKSISNKGVFDLDNVANPAVIVACFILAPHRPVNRQVAPDEGEKLAQTNKAAWVETSAKNNINVGMYNLDFTIRAP